MAGRVALRKVAARGRAQAVVLAVVRAAVVVAVADADAVVDEIALTEAPGTPYISRAVLGTANAQLTR
jgi:hypothetical protein